MGKKKFGEKMANKRWKHDPNPWKPLLLIPYDVAGWPDLHRFEGGREEEHEEHDEHGGENGGDSWAHKGDN